nr:hypothetical protein [Granulosicoccus sp.]
YSNTEDDLYQRVLNSWSEAGIVELSAVVGYYSLVAMTLNVHQIPLPEGTVNALPAAPDKHLFEIPAAKKISLDGVSAIPSEQG